jgi:hypothetical protein
LELGAPALGHGSIKDRRTTSSLLPADTAEFARADGRLVGAASFGNGGIKQPERGEDMADGQNGRFDPPERFASAARITGTSEHEVAAANPEGWRAGQAKAPQKVAECGDAEE